MFNLFAKRFIGLPLRIFLFLATATLTHLFAAVDTKLVTKGAGDEVEGTSKKLDNYQGPSEDEQKKIQQENQQHSKSLSQMNQDEVEVRQSFKEHGRAYLKRIVNETNYNIEIEVEGGASGVDRLLLQDSVIRIKSLSSAHGEEKKFLVVSQESDELGSVFNYPLRASGTDPGDKACHFKVDVSIDEEGKAFFGFSSVLFPDKRIQSSYGSDDEHLVVCGRDAFKEKSKPGDACRWELVSVEGIAQVYFKNVLTGGYLGLTQIDKTVSKPVRRFDYARAKGSVFSPPKVSSFDDLLRVRGEKSLQFVSWVIEKAFQFFAKKPDDEKVLGYLQNKMSLTSDMIGQVFGESETKVDCCYGDVVKIKSTSSMQPLVVILSNDEDRAILSNRSDEDDFDLFVLKGPHSETDRYNCYFGQPIKSGSQIRLEHVASRKNLAVSGDVISFPKEALWGESGKHLRYYTSKKLKLSGKNGIGSFADNWIINSTTARKNIEMGAPFMLQHLETTAALCAETAVDDLGQIVSVVSETEESKQQRKDQVSKSGKASAEKEIKNVEKMQESARDKKEKQKKKKSGQLNDDESVLKSEKGGPGGEPSLRRNPLEGQQNWIVDFVRKPTVKEKGVMRTGFRQGAPFERIDMGRSAVEKNQMMAVEIVKNVSGEVIIKGADVWKNIPLDNRSVRLVGLSSQNVPDLISGMTLNMGPMLERGMIWKQRSLKTPSRFAMSFLVKVKDDSDFSVVLGDDISSRCRYRIVFGRGGGSFSAIDKLNESSSVLEYNEVYRVSAENNPNATLRSGAILPVWVMFDNGTIFVGQSTEVGDNIMMAYKDLGFSGKIDRVGFSCNKNDVFIAGFSIKLPLKVAAPIRQYKEFGDEPVPTLENPSDVGFRVPNQIFLNLRTDELRKQKVLLASADKTESYLLDINAVYQNIKITKKQVGGEKVVFDSNCSSLKDKLGGGVSLWLNYDRGLIFCGMGGSPGERPLFFFQDQAPLENISTFGCEEIGELAFNSGSAFEVDGSVDIDEKSVLGNKFIGLSPFDYTVNQDGEWIVIKDMVSRRTYFASKAPQRGAVYAMMLTINSKGVPRMRWTWQPENADIMNKKMGAAILGTAADAFNQAAGYIEGHGSLGQIVGAIAGTGIAAASIPFAYRAAKMEADAQYDYGLANDTTAIKAAHSVGVKDMVGSGVSPELEKKRSEVKRIVEVTKVFSPHIKDQFYRLLAETKKAVPLITSPLVIEDPLVKSTLIKTIETLYVAHRGLFGPDAASGVEDERQFGIRAQNSHQELIDLLVRAAQNQILNDVTIEEDTSRSRSWIARSNLLFQQILKKDPEVEFEIPPLFSDYFWLEDRFPEEGRGKVRFQARGSGRVLVAIGKETGRYFGTKKDLYEVSLINSEDTVCEIRLSCMGPEAVKSVDERLRLSQFEFKTFWVSVDGGKIKVGVVDDFDEEVEVLSFSDPLPESQELRVGFGTWNADAQIARISVSGVATLNEP